MIQTVVAGVVLTRKCGGRRHRIKGGNAAPVETDKVLVFIILSAKARKSP